MRRLLLAIGMLLLAPPATAATIEGVEFAESVRVGDTELALSGMGLLRYRVIFRGYVSALYLPEGADPKNVLGDVPKRLVIEYFWSIGGDAIREAGEEILERNVSDATFASLRDRVRKIGKLYEDVEPGDRYALTYLPGRGTTLAKNGRELGTIEGADFARAYFAIWLGEDPIDASLRDQLLRGR